MSSVLPGRPALQSIKYSTHRNGSYRERKVVIPKIAYKWRTILSNGGRRRLGLDGCYRKLHLSLLHARCRKVDGDRLRAATGALRGVSYWQFAGCFHLHISSCLRRQVTLRACGAATSVFFRPMLCISAVHAVVRYLSVCMYASVRLSCSCILWKRIGPKHIFFSKKIS